MQRISQWFSFVVSPFSLVVINDAPRCKIAAFSVIFEVLGCYLYINQIEQLTMSIETAFFQSVLAVLKSIYAALTSHQLESRTESVVAA